MEEIKIQLSQDEYLEYIEQWKLDNKELIESGKCRKVFTEILTKILLGTKRNNINWESCDNKLIFFIYDNIKDWIKIINYDKSTKMLKLEYKNIEFNITHSNFLKCKIGRKIGEIKYSRDYVYKIGNIIKDKRNLVIIDIEYREVSKGSRRFYKYKCKVCGNEDWIREDAIMEQNQGCNVCSGHKVILGYNDIPTTVPWMVKYFQRGYDEAKLYTKTGSGNPNNRYGKINPICPDCDRIKSKKVRINDIYRNHTIGCSCSDSIPYPEKVLFSVFEQLGVDFQTQLNKTTFDWCGKYKYDFYFKLNNERILTETHGRQHYEDAWDKLEKTQTNDRIKKELALVNGIKEENYIIIDCRYSELDWIKQHILESNLAKMFDLSKIDWLKAEEFASSNRVNEACDLWNSGIHSTTQIGIIMKLHGTTVMRYLKIGYDLDLCNYTKSISAKEAVKNATLSTSKQVICCENGIIFKSTAECSRKSKQLLGINICEQSISNVCNKNLKQTKTKGYHFKYISDLTEEEIKQIQENAKLNQAI